MLGSDGIYEGYTGRLKTISDEHVRLSKLLDAFDKQVDEMERASFESVKDILSDILVEMSNHFIHEEEIMLEVGYPYYLEHKENHRRILGLIQNLASQYKSGVSGVRSKIKSFIETSIFDHLEKYDRDLIVLLSEKF